MTRRNRETTGRAIGWTALATVLGAVLSAPQTASAQRSSGFGVSTGTPDEAPATAEQCAALGPDAGDGLRLTPWDVLTLEFHSVCLDRWAQDEDLAGVTLQVAAYLHSPGNVERLLHVPSWTIAERSKPGAPARGTARRRCGPVESG